MSVTAVTAISSYSQEPAPRPHTWRRDLLSLQHALSEGNLDSAQQALTRFQQDVHNIRPQQNGIRASAEVNPASTMRADLQALQSAIDSGDLAMVEEAFIRVQQDIHNIAGSPAEGPGQASRALLVVGNGDDGVGLAAQRSEQSNGNLVDVSV